MGFSVSASTAIVFAGMFLAVGILYPAVSNGFEQVQDAEVERDSAQLDLRNTQIEIDSDQTNSDQITVNNTGTTSLKISEVDLIVDGEYQSRDSDNGDGDFEITNEGAPNGDTDLWLPGEQIRLHSFTAEERIKVVTEHGISVSTEV